jgi:hypothetical protein
VAGIGHIVLVLVLVLVLAPVPSLEHGRGLELPELPPPWNLGYTFGVVDTDLGEHVGGVGLVVFDGIAGPDGHVDAES